MKGRSEIFSSLERKDRENGANCDAVETVALSKTLKMNQMNTL